MRRSHSVQLKVDRLEERSQPWAGFLDPTFDGDGLVVSALGTGYSYASSVKETARA